MKMSDVIDHFDELLRRVIAGESARKYIFDIRGTTTGLCAEMSSGTDIATIARSIADFMPVDYPSELAAPIALLIFADQSLRCEQRRLIAVDEETVFAPSIAYAALHALAPIISNVRYFDALGCDKDPKSMLDYCHNIDTIFIAGRRQSIAAYWQSIPWPRTGIIVYLADFHEDQPLIGPKSAYRSQMALGRLQCTVECWGA